MECENNIEGLKKIFLDIENDTVFTSTEVDYETESFNFTLRVKSESLKGEDPSAKADSFKTAFQLKTSTQYIVKETKPNAVRYVVV
jgi:hypothetical protein